MRSKVLQILWHSKDPVFSLDFHPNGMLVTGGQDKQIMVGMPSFRPRQHQKLYGGMVACSHRHSRPTTVARSPVLPSRSMKA